MLLIKHIDTHPQSCSLLTVSHSPLSVWESFLVLKVFLENGKDLTLLWMGRAEQSMPFHCHIFLLLLKGIEVSILTFYMFIGIGQASGFGIWLHREYIYIDI